MSDARPLNLGEQHVVDDVKHERRQEPVERLLQRQVRGERVGAAPRQRRRPDRQLLLEGGACSRSAGQHAAGRACGSEPPASLSACSFLVPKR